MATVANVIPTDKPNSSNTWLPLNSRRWRARDCHSSLLTKKMKTVTIPSRMTPKGFDISNTFPAKINFRRGGYIATAIALVLYPWAPWETGTAYFVNFIGSAMRPVFRVMMVDYYLIRKCKIDVNALYQENVEFRFQGGFHTKAFIAFGAGIIVSSILPTFTTLLPMWWGTYGWFFGVGVGGAVYYALRAGAADVSVTE